MSFEQRAGLLIAGIEHPFPGGVVLVVPPLSLGALERLQGGVAALQAATATDPKAIKTVVDATHLALQRNYPNITRDEVAELVDLENMLEVISMVMDVAGVRRKAKAAEGNPAGPAAVATTETPPPPTGPAS